MNKMPQTPSRPHQPIDQVQPGKRNRSWRPLERIRAASFWRAISGCDNRSFAVHQCAADQL